MYEIDDNVPMLPLDKELDEEEYIDNNCGIYCIENLINKKKYIGKSKNIHRRLWQHKNQLAKEKRFKDCNIYLFASAKKHGLENFKFYTLEILPINDSLLMEREIYWMDFYNSCNRDFGYNLRRDTQSGMKVHEDTIKRMSEAFKGEKNPNYGNRWSNELKAHMSKIKKELAASRTDEEKEIIGKNIGAGIKKFYEDNPQAREHMSKAVSNAKKKKHSFLQLDKKTEEVLNIWESVEDIVKVYPFVKWQNIYSVCNGYKGTYLGFKWRKVPKIPRENYSTILTSGRSTQT